MNFLNKKILLGTIIIVVLIIAIGIGSFFYWQEIYNKQEVNTSPSISQEEIQAKCFENVSKMSDEELINEIKDLKYVREVALEDEEDKLNFAISQTTKYLNCKLANNKDEQLYNTAKGFIQELMIQKENKEKYLKSLDDTYSRIKIEDSFIFQLALRDLNEICPDKLPDLCLKGATQFFSVSVEDDCKNICHLIEQYSNNRNKLYAEIINNKEWTNDDSYYESQYKFRIAMAYYFGKQDLALRICDNVNNLERDKCLEWVKDITNQEAKNKNKECNGIQEILEELICRIIE